ncbi:MAG: hypothetical protein IKS51_04230 [Erysipelotrichaceae bacterium]|nr:hypothetical protein [Erysipelotrichaceae bacterium]
MFRLTITNPSDSTSFIDYGRHFMVFGEIIHDEELPEDAVLSVYLFDSEGNTARHVKQIRKNDENVFLDLPGMTFYPKGMDDDRKQLLKFGFPELQVKDLKHPEESLRDATIKAYYNDTQYKALIVSASDMEHGAFLDDGMHYHDENGNPYDVLPEGEYTISVELKQNDHLLATASRPIRISIKEKAIICRFNPLAHKQAMVEFSRRKGLDITTDTLPGYLEPYLGTWLYHMGYLKMFRANDVAFYQKADVTFFIYLFDPDSTSYKTELPYLRTHRDIEDPEHFTYYHYDIGEAKLQKCERKGKAIRFHEDEFLYTCRIDVVRKECQENVFYLDESQVIRSITDLNDATVNFGDTIAIMNVVRPGNISKEYLILNEDNTYSIENEIDTLHYEFVLEDQKIETERKLMMKRISDYPLAESVFEAYNIFSITEEMRNKDIAISISAYDRSGNRCKGNSRFILKVR